MIFEIHITAFDIIHEVARTFKHKTISVNLLRPDLSVIRTEHMTSFVIDMPDDIAALCYLNRALEMYRKAGVVIIRSKIETPFNVEYLRYAKYIEAHFEPNGETKFPISQNVKKQTLMATDREYDFKKFVAFNEKYSGKKDCIIELCLHDSFVQEDKDWFDCYENTRSDNLWSESDCFCTLCKTKNVSVDGTCSTCLERLRY